MMNDQPNISTTERYKRDVMDNKNVVSKSALEEDLQVRYCRPCTPRRLFIFTPSRLFNVA